MDKDMLMRELHSYEFGCRNILYLILKSFSICCPCQKRLVRMVYYSKILKNIFLFFINLPHVIVKRSQQSLLMIAVLVLK